MSKKDRLLIPLVCAVFAFLGGIASSSGLISVKSAGQSPKLVKAERLEIIDDEGRVVAAISSHPGGAKLMFFDGKEKLRLDIGFNHVDYSGKSQPGIFIYDQDGKKSIWSAK